MPARSYEPKYVVPEGTDERLIQPLFEILAILRGSQPGFPIRVNDANVTARGAVITDSTRLDTNAQGMFLPNAIPVFPEASFGLGTRTTMQGQGSSASLSWIADIGSPAPLSGAFKAEFLNASVTGISIFAPQAWVRWDKVLVGVSDSTFTDLDTIPDTIDLSGPNGRAWVRNGQPQIRYTYLTPYDPSEDPTGLYGNIAIEAPSAEVYLPTGQGAFTPFSRYPDLIGTLRFESTSLEFNSCIEKNVRDPNFHLQAGFVVRDLGVERAAGNIRETAAGWGTQLSSRYTIFHCDSCGNMLRDYLMATATVGEGIGHYFNDLRMVAAVNDAAYDVNANTLSPLPVTAFFVGYQHSWTTNLRSTAVYSRIDLDSENIPFATGNAPYQSGEIISCNLMWHAEPCVYDAQKKSNVEHNLFVGIEYLYGLKENLADRSGDNHRVMFVIAASK
jgi:hypothetical protein